MKKRQIAVILVVGVAIFMALNMLVPKVLSDAKQAMCDEGSLAVKYCDPAPDKRSEDD